MRNGAQLLAVPTNNATFGDTEMTYQQLAMSRVRAVEHGRAVVVAATSGVSAIIAPDGAMTSQTDLFVPAALVAKVPLSTSSTLATRVGPAPEMIGTAMSRRSSRVVDTARAAVTATPTTLRWLWTQPLGEPVVPEV